MNPPSSPGKARVLIIDDDAFVRSAMKKVLDREGYEVAAAGGGAEGLQYLRTSRWNVVLLDQDMPDVPGEKVLKTINDERLEGSVIVFSTFAGEDQEQKFRDLGAAALVNKGVDIDALLAIVKKELARTGHG